MYYDSKKINFSFVIFIACILLINLSNVRAGIADIQVRSICPEKPCEQHPRGNNSILKCNPCHYEIALISDNDEKSKSKTKDNLWESKFVRTTIHLNVTDMKFTLGAFNEIILTSSLNSEGLGMELSELVYFNGNLLTFDDKTGTIFKIVNNHVQPWVTLISCEGTSKREGFKSEWATIKDNKLYVGSSGYPWSSKNKNETEPNCGPQWIKVVSQSGAIEHVSWKREFDKIQDATKCKGYVTHESAVWSNIHKKWFFAPRKCSTEDFDPKTDDKKGSNLLINVDEKFEKFEVVEIGKMIPSKGFSSIKFLPQSNDSIIVGLKTSENEKSFQTYLSVFHIKGEIYLQDTLISKVDKFEGVEFMHK